MCVRVYVCGDLLHVTHILHVLLQDKRPELVGSTVTGYEDIYRRLKTFKHRQAEVSATGQRLSPSTVQT